MLPNLIIAGAPKCGTTSVNQWLTDHPDVAGPAVKETEYFVDTTSHAYRPEANFNDQGIPGYEAFFDHIGTDSPPVVLESAPDYMYQQTALAHLPDLATRPRMVFLLREPAAQIYSLFHYLQNNFQYVPQSMTFEQFVALAQERSPALAHHELLQNAIHNARYVVHLNKWIERCGEDRVSVYLFDDLVADSQSFAKRLSSDLGVDPTYYDTYDFAAGNKTYRVRSHALQSLSIALRNRLPKGSLYNLMRDAYRRLNTTSGAVDKADRDRRALATLRETFATDNAALAERFGLDVSRWNN